MQPAPAERPTEPKRRERHIVPGPRMTSEPPVLREEVAIPNVERVLDPGARR